ncbi:hypothetical protein EV175_007299, partial [Coemansia sp. RSA 1933]
MNQQLYNGASMGKCPQMSLPMDRAGMVARTMPSISAVLSGGFPAVLHAGIPAEVLTAFGLRIIGEAPTASATNEISRANTTSPARNRAETVLVAPMSRHNSHAELDASSDRSTATPSFGVDTQSSRSTYRDINVHTHTPARDTMHVAMHTIGHNSMHSASAGDRDMQDDAAATPTPVTAQEIPSPSHR